jgi:hypothetical protein
VPQVRQTCPGLPWGVPGPKKMGAVLRSSLLNHDSWSLFDRRTLKNLCKNSKPNSVPQGRLNLAQDASPGLDLKGRPVPKGRLKIGRDAILDNLQPSLRDQTYKTQFSHTLLKAHTFFPTAAPLWRIRRTLPPRPTAPLWRIRRLRRTLPPRPRHPYGA